MIYSIVPFPVTLSDLSPRFQGNGAIFMPIDAFSVFCAQLTRELLAIAKFLFVPFILPSKIVRRRKSLLNTCLNHFIEQNKLFII